jgi:hypothetical protein
MPLVLSAPPLALRLRQNKRPYGYAGVVVHRSSAAAPSTPSGWICGEHEQDLTINHSMFGLKIACEASVTRHPSKIPGNPGALKRVLLDATVLSRYKTLENLWNRAEMPCRKRSSDDRHQSQLPSNGIIFLLTSVGDYYDEQRRTHAR